MLGDGDQSSCTPAAERAAELATGIVERYTGLVLVRRKMTPVFVHPDLRLTPPIGWFPNGEITTVRVAQTFAVYDTEPADWPAVEFRKIHGSGGAHLSEPVTELRIQTKITFPSTGNPVETLPNIRLEGSAGALHEQMVGESQVPDGNIKLADLIGAAEDVLRFIWGRRQSSRNAMSVDNLEASDAVVTWSRRLPLHVATVLNSHRRMIVG